MKIKIILFILLVSHNLFAQHENQNFRTDSVLLDEVIVTSTLPINNQNIINFYRTNNFSTIDDITSRLEGISLIKRGVYAMEPQLGGFSGGQLNITIDGMRIFGACTDKMDPVTSYIEPSNLKSISVSHGTNADNGCNIGGSVDLTLKEPATSKNYEPNSSIAFGLETVSNGRNLIISTGLGSNKWSWGLNGVYRKNDNYTDGRGKIVQFTQFEKTNIHTNLKYQPDEKNSFKTDLLYDLACNVGYPALPMDVSKAQAILVALEYKHIDHNNFKVKLYFNDVYHVMDDSKRDSAFVVSNQLSGNNDTVIMRMDMPGRSTTFGLYGQYILNLNEKNKLTIKLDNYSNRSLAEMTMYMHFKDALPEAPMYMQTWPDMVRNVSGLYMQHTFSESNKYMLMLNGRLDFAIDQAQNDLAHQQFSILNYDLPQNFTNLTKAFNASIKYHIADKFSSSLIAGFSERLPTNTERYGFYLYNAYDGYDYIGNPYLKTEKSLFSELLLSYTTPKLKIKFTQNISKLTDYIMGENDLTLQQLNFYANGIRIFKNYSGASLINSNFQIFYKPLPSITLFSLTKYTYGRLDKGDPLPLIPPLNNITAINFQKDKWAILLENETSLAQNRINIAYNETKTPAFNVINLRGNYQFDFSKTKMELAFGVSNLLNKTYYEHLDWGKILRPGRSINFYLKYSF